ncbi:cation diffusion facilitator family transporter [Sphingomonas alba]|uniref:Cation diffusion facilitator family transporter n=1 Tax=Sphingomonas alba TaxID=2908208 RepID=A0ABT0RPX1_9SPHN|nr:cation diffusion facilitator family transporter [Sphingomonas alba]MCL6684678.1 cation diffusion facilitator family transporter [Sphingomonas alba]
MTTATQAPIDPAVRARLTTRAALASVSMALLLLAAKAWAVIQTGSVAMLGSLADTALDVLASVITLLGVRWAAMPADEEHRFGHGKAEALAALIQVVLITISALGIAWRSVQRLGSGEGTTGLESGVVVSIAAMCATLLLLWYQRLVIRRTGSVAIATDNVHYQSDLLLNFSVIAALGLDQLFGWKLADPVFGLLIAAWLMYGAWNAASHSVDQLMDREWDDEARERLIALIKTHPELHGIHELRTRRSGGHDFIQFHIWLDPRISLTEAHRIMDEVEAVVKSEFPGVETIIHPDPRGLAEPGQELRA